MIASLMNFLDENGVKYAMLTHSPAFTAQCIAGMAHVPGRELAKTVMVKVDGELAMAVLAANDRVDLHQLKQAIGATGVVLATEEDFYERFADCETGAMPPLGNRYGMTTYVEQGLAQAEEITFNAGTHRELIRMDWNDFLRTVRPRILAFALGRSAQAA